MSEALPTPPNVIAFPFRAHEAADARVDASDLSLSDERLRIARELHDVVGYSFATIAIQAEIAARALEQRPEQARMALEEIRSASSQTLRELRGILGMLRNLGDSDASRHGLNTLDELAATTTAAGLPTSVEIEGRVRSVPAAVDLAAFRIVQESLTNVLRHARAGSALVTVGYERDCITVQVDDDGSCSCSPISCAPGYGIAGMRERAAALGGELHAGWRDEDGGFRVQARLPVLGRP
jgi:signal transduction histidine kinase